jgi:hypothetical protein
VNPPGNRSSRKQRDGGFGHVDDAEKVCLDLRPDVVEAGILDGADISVAGICTSSLPKVSTAAATASRAPRGSVASRAKVRTWLSYFALRPASRAGLRAVESNLWPAAKTASASARPRPLGLPVMS